MASAVEYADWIVSNKDKKGTPEFQKVADAYQIAKELEQPELTTGEKFQTSPAGRFAEGVAQPFIGAGNLITKGVDAVFGTNIGQENIDFYQKRKQEQEALNKRAGVGTNVAGFLGEMVSPINVLPAGGALKAMKLAKALKPSIGKIGQATAGGTVAGGLTGATMPTQGEDFWAEKGIQTGSGAVGGAVMTPVIVKVAEKVVGHLGNLKAKRNVTLADIEDSIRRISKDYGINYEGIDGVLKENLKKQVETALGKGKQLDIASALRKQDAGELGVKITQGAITRDPAQYGLEYNLRNQSPEIMNVLKGTNQNLETKLGKFSEGARDNYDAGKLIIKSIEDIDTKMQKNVSKLYDDARKSSGADIDVPLAGFADDIGKIVDDYGDDIFSGGVQKNLEKYGLFGTDQKRVFTFGEADKLLKVINKNVGSDATKNSALAELRQALKRTYDDIEADNVFAPAVKAARDRFGLHDTISALKAVSSGKVKNDKFVNNFIINSETDDLVKLGNLLAKESPEAFNEVKKQLGKFIHDSAFGGQKDKTITVASLKKAIDKLGKDKLSAFFSKDEIAEIERIYRVGSYQFQDPAFSTRGSSNTAIAAALDRLSSLPAVGNPAQLAKMGRKGIDERKALKEVIPSTNRALSAKDKKIIEMLTAGSGVGAGGLGVGLTQ